MIIIIYNVVTNSYLMLPFSFPADHLIEGMASFVFCKTHKNVPAMAECMDDYHLIVGIGDNVASFPGQITYRKDITIR